MKLARKTKLLGENPYPSTSLPTAFAPVQTPDSMVNSL